MLITGSTQEEITIINMYVPKHRAQKYVKETERTEGRNRSGTKMKDVRTPHFQ